VIRVAALLLATTATATAAPEAPKKDRERATKSEKSQRPLPKVGAKPAPLVNVYNTWTHEWLAVDPAALPAPDVVDSFLRDHYTNEPTAMEQKLVGILAAAASHFDSSTVYVVSAFRHPKYNLLLRKKGHQVARDSNHTHGNAVDFYLAGVNIQRLHAWAKEQKLGGVGIYLGSGFVHMDTGRVRYWSGD
jgi:hypothetical protein